MPLVVVIVLILIVLVVGGFVVGLTLTLLGYVITGLIVGALARLLLPGPQELGWLATILYGVAGSLIGGIAGDAIGVGAILQFILAIVAAAILIALFAAAAPRGRPA